MNKLWFTYTEQDSQSFKNQMDTRANMEKSLRYIKGKNER